jgi:hypothetical protein
LRNLKLLTLSVDNSIHKLTHLIPKEIWGFFFDYLEYSNILITFAQNIGMDVFYDKILLTGIILYWFITTVYMFMWHAYKGNLNAGTIFLSIFFGVAIAPILYQEERKSRRANKINEEETYAEYLRNYRARYNNVPVINNTKEKKKEFKLLRGYDKDR